RKLPGTRFHIKNRGLRFGRAGPTCSALRSYLCPKNSRSVSPFFITFWRKEGQTERPTIWLIDRIAWWPGLRKIVWIEKESSPGLTVLVMLKISRCSNHGAKQRLSLSRKFMNHESQNAKVLKTPVLFAAGQFRAML